MPDDSLPPRSLFAERGVFTASTPLAVDCFECGRSISQVAHFGLIPGRGWICAECEDLSEGLASATLFEPCHITEPHLRHTWGPRSTADHFCAGIPAVTTCADCGCEGEDHNDPTIGGCTACGICGGLQ